ncbi:MAG: hypothetical protein ACK4RN_13500 [Pseudorhodobacter sp.]
MTRHLADRQRSGDGGRVKHFLRLSRDGSESLWAEAYRKPKNDAASDGEQKDRRVAEFLRIDRGRTT